MDHEVQGELAVFGVKVAHGVGAGHGPLLARELLADPLYVEGLGIGRALGREKDLDVVVGAGVRREVRESVAAEHHALHVRGEAFGADDLCGVRLPRLASRSFCHVGLPIPYA